jgi:hypothetical protein
MHIELFVCVLWLVNVWCSTSAMVKLLRLGTWHTSGSRHTIGGACIAAPTLFISRNNDLFRNLGKLRYVMWK